jgi:phosphatidylglycerol lysyltransferase
VALMGLLNVTSSAFFPLPSRLSWLRQTFPMEIILGSRNLNLVAGFFLIALAWSLAERKRIAWLLTTWLMLISALSHVLKGLDVAEAIVALVLLVLLWALRRDFSVRSDPGVIQSLLFAAPYALILFFGYAVLGFYLLQRQFQPGFDLGTVIQDTLNLATLQGGQIYQAHTRQAHYFATSIPLMAGAGVLYLVYSLMRPVLRPTPVTRRDRSVAAQIIRLYGSSSLAYFALGHDKTYFFNDEGSCIIPYTLVRDVALSAGDPIGPQEDIGPTIDTFRALCDENDWTPAFYQVQEATLPLYRDAQFDALKIGEEALLDLPDFTTRGEARKDLRTAANRARREGWQFHFFDRPIGNAVLVAKLQAISEAWLADKFGGEMGFTMGGTPITGSHETLVSAATDSQGQLLAFVTWAPMYGARGWVVDFMRRASDAPNGAMEYVMVETITCLRERGDQIVSLGLAPLANVQASDAEAILSLEKGIELIYRRFNTAYGFKSLHDFKKKFAPRWESRYLAYRGLTVLPRVGYALVNAQMPNFSLNDMAKLVRPS